MKRACSGAAMLLYGATLLSSPASSGENIPTISSPATEVRDATAVGSKTVGQSQAAMQVNYENWQRSQATNQALTHSHFPPTTPDLPIGNRAATALSRGAAWQDAQSIGSAPVASPDGGVSITFGVDRPEIVCAVLNVTDIELQKGEQVLNVALGDSARWKAECVSNAGTPHIFIKPTDTGLQTSMIVGTDRRTYHFKLTSSRDRYMARVTFTYPQEITAMLIMQEKKKEEARKKDTIPETNEYLGDLCFDYKVSGKASWKPQRVYNDGRKTILEMPFDMEQTEAPTLLIVRNKEQTLVNYRVQNRRYIVDSVFDEGILIAGVGRKQEKVNIRYLGRKKAR